MKPKNPIAHYLSLFSLAGVLWAAPSMAANVGVGLYSLSPNPVTIQAGDSVFWYEDDEDFGPYMIMFSETEYTFTPGGFTFYAPGTYQYTASSVYGGGGWGGTVIVTQGTPNSPPSVTITSPTNNSVFTAPATFDIEATASDPDNNLWDVWFYVDGELVDEVVNPPFKTTVTGLPVGTYTLTAVAWDYFEDYDDDWLTITVIEPVTGPITLTVTRAIGGQLELEASGLTSGKNVVLESSQALGTAASWTPVSTKFAVSATLSFTNSITPGRRFFRVKQMP